MSRSVVPTRWANRGVSYRLGAECFREYLLLAEAMGPVTRVFFAIQMGDGRFSAELYVHVGYFLDVLVPEIEKIEAEYSVVIDMGNQFTRVRGHARLVDNREVTLRLVRSMSVDTRIRVGFLVSESVEDAETSELQTYIAPDEGQTFLKFHNED